MLETVTVGVVSLWCPMGAKRRRKIERWALPETFKVAEQSDAGTIQRQDGEPVTMRLVKHANDNTVAIDHFDVCCACGLEHHFTYNVMKDPDGAWWLVRRAYQVPGTWPLEVKRSVLGIQHG